MENGNALTARFGLIGKPIAHSKSPALFTAAYGGSWSYELLEAESCENAVKRFLEGPYKGINVTAPYKEQAMRFVTAPDAVSSRLGNANLLLKDGDYLRNGVVYSYNTDYYGVKNTVRDFCGERCGTVTVIGAGGAGKAATLAMADSGYDVCLVNRSRENAAAFAQAAGAEYVPLQEAARAIEKSWLVIYSLSMLPDEVKEADFSDKVIFEANYASPNLSPEQNVKSRFYIRGEYWLYNQAVPAFELFTGCKPDCEAMKKVMGI